MEETEIEEIVSDFVLIDTRTELTEKEKIEKKRKEEIIAQELHKLQSNTYELQCAVLSNMKNLIPGMLTLTEFFLSFEPIEKGLVISHKTIGTKYDQYRTLTSTKNKLLLNT